MKKSVTRPIVLPALALARIVIQVLAMGAETLCTSNERQCAYQNAQLENMVMILDIVNLVIHCANVALVQPVMNAHSAMKVDISRIQLAYSIVGWVTITRTTEIFVRCVTLVAMIALVRLIKIVLFVILAK